MHAHLQNISFPSINTYIYIHTYIYIYIYIYLFMKGRLYCFHSSLHREQSNNRTIIYLFLINYLNLIENIK